MQRAAVHSRAPYRPPVLSGRGAALVALALPLAVATCRVDQVLDPFGTRVVTVEITGATVGVADSVRLTATVRVDGTPTAGLPLIWTSSDPAVATVDDAGLVRGVARGRAAIQATLAPSAAVTVTGGATDSVRVVAAGLTLAPADTLLTSLGDTLCLRPTALDALGRPLPDPVTDVRKVTDPDGIVTGAADPRCVVALTTGRPATLMATMDTLTASATVAVTQTVATLSVTPGSAQLARLGDQAVLGVTAADRRGNAVPAVAVAWSAADTSVVRVDSTGTVTARGTGTTRVHATANGAADSATISVTPPVLSVTPGSVAASAARGSTARPGRTVRIGNTGSGALTWSAATLGGSAWLTLAPVSGTADSLVASFDPAGLAAGTYGDTIVITSAGAEGSPDSVAVTFTVTPCQLHPVAPDTTVAFTLADTDCGAPSRAGRFARVFTYDAVAGDTVNIVLTGSADAYLVLTDGAGTVLAENDECVTNTAAGPACFLNRALVAGPLRVEATTAAAQATGSFTLRLTRPVPPAAVQAPAQFRGDSTTAIAVGDTTPENAVVLRAQVSDADSGDVLTLDVEVRPVGVAFTGTPTGSVGGLASGATARVRVTGLTDDTGYHWQARAVDQTGRAGPWTSFGGNAESAADFHVAVPEPPAVPAALGQFESDGTTPIAIGASALGTTVVFRGTVTDPDPGDSLRLEVEVLPVGTAFTGGTTFVSARVLSGAAASVSVALTDDENYHWRARVVDRTGRTSAWLSFGGNAESAADFNIPPVPEPPFDPAGLGQFLSDGVTPIALGDSTDETTVVFRATVTDPDPGAMLQLAVEVRPVGVAFTNTPTATGTAVASGAVASVTVAGLTEDTDYHWQARVVDETARTSNWVSFGGNAESARDFRIAVPEPPNPPTALGQRRSDGTTVIAVGDTTPEATVILRGTVSDPDAGDRLRLQVEVRPLGVAFTGVPTATSAVTVANGAVATVTVTGLSDDTGYHWQARAIDQVDSVSSWVSFGGNAESAADFRVAVPEVPGAPAALAQFQGDSTTAIGTGDTIAATVLVVSAAVTDPDPGDVVRLQVEIRPVGVAFTGTPSATSVAAVASGGTAFARVTGLSDDTPYHWQARAIDQTGRTGAWVSYGGNAETATDVHVAIPENPLAPAAFAQLKGDSTTPVAIGAVTDEAVIVLEALASDPDPGDSLYLDVEVRPVGVAFTDVVTASSAGRLGNGVVRVRVTGLADDTPYHWQARARDQTGRTGPWMSAGGNAETVPDFSVAVPEAPAAPTGPAQLKSDGITVLGLGSTTDERTVVFRATVTDPDPGDQLRVQVEVRRIGEAFTGTPTATGTVSVASGGVASVTATGLADDTTHHWRIRAIDQTSRFGPWTSFGGNLETDTDFRVEAPEPPADPTALAQRRASNGTVIALGDTIQESGVEFRATVTDPDPGALLQLQVEVRAIGSAFTGTPTATGAAQVSSGGTASVTVPGLADDTDHHWRGRVIDETGRTSNWVSFGGNADGQRDFRVAVPETPLVPSALAQLKSDSVTGIATGATTDEATVVFAATVNDPDQGDTLRLEVEVQPVGTAFANTASGTSGFVARNATARVRLSGLTDDFDYHWQARTVDHTGRASAWVSYGGNAESAPDFHVAVPENPNAPTGAAQRQSDGTTNLPVGGTTPDGRVTFRANVTDPDPGDQLRIQVETQPIGTPFTGTPTVTSAVAAGGVASVLLGPQADDRGYHWQVRTIDQTNRVSAWVSFGGNLESEADYLVAIPENPAPDPTGLDQFEADGVTVIPVGGNSGGSAIVLKATLFDPDPGDQLTLQVEFRSLANAFTGTATDVALTSVASGAVGQVTVATVVGTSYHWQARACDQTGRCSAWVSFGKNLETEADVVGTLF